MYQKIVHIALKLLYLFSMNARFPSSLIPELQLILNDSVDNIIARLGDFTFLESGEAELLREYLSSGSFLLVAEARQLSELDAYFALKRVLVKLKILGSQ